MRNFVSVMIALLSILTICPSLIAATPKIGKSPQDKVLESVRQQVSTSLQTNSVKQSAFSMLRTNPETPYTIAATYCDLKRSGSDVKGAYQAILDNDSELIRRNRLTGSQAKAINIISSNSVVYAISNQCKNL